MNIPHNNIDNVFKESLSLFKDKALDFLGLADIAPITDHLGTESVQIDITWEFRDLAFAIKDGRGINFEEEIHLSDDDLLRIAGYNTGLRRMHKREFITVIFVKEPTKLKGIYSQQLTFEPYIVQCSEINADALLDKLKAAVSAGKPINELEAIYLPLFHSKTLSPTELFLESAALIKAMQAEDDHKRKTLALLVTLSGKLVDYAKLKALVEEVRNMGNVFAQVFEDIGRENEKENIATKMLDNGMDPLDIIKFTGITPERLLEIRESLRSSRVAATG